MKILKIGRYLGYDANACHRKYIKWIKNEQKQEKEIYNKTNINFEMKIP